jgi:hypothetical protein
MMKVMDRGLELTTRKRGATKTVRRMCDAGSNSLEFTNTKDNVENVLNVELLDTKLTVKEKEDFVTVDDRKIRDQPKCLEVKKKKTSTFMETSSLRSLED